MIKRIQHQLGKATWTVLAIALALLVVWVLTKLLFAAAWLTLLVGLVMATLGIVGADVRALTGLGDKARRPWLVRFREYRWRPVWTPFGRPLPRWAAYAGIILGWLWLF